MARDRIVRSKVKKMVVVSLENGEGFRGILFDSDRESLLLRDAFALEANGSDRVPVGADGEMLFRWAKVAYCQIF